MTKEPTARTTTAQPDGQTTANHPPATDSTDRPAINRANSKHSTGPRTEAGKQRSALNALRHGLTGQTIVLPSDDLIAYQSHCKRFLLEYQPKTETEEHFVQTIADTAWRLNRIPALENNLLTLGMMEHEDSVHTDPQICRALAMAQTYREQSHVFANLGIHEQRLARLFEKTLKQLRAIQAERRAIEKEQLANAAVIMELHQDEGLPYDPAQDGFVFSPAEIDTCIQRNDRLKLARRANFHRQPRALATAAPSQ
jgi:hypothetical protein